MKLSSLVYEIVRDAIEIPSGFNFDGFIRGDFDEDSDFISQISFVFNYVNLGFSRLITMQKTCLKTTKKYSDETGYIDFKQGEVTAVVSNMSRDYERVLFREFNEGIAVEKEYVGKVVFVEFRPSIPRFDISSIRSVGVDDEDNPTFIEKTVELTEYGITEDMCSYVKEYAKGGLLEYLSPELSQRHTQIAETYFAALKTRYTNYPQRKVENRFNGGAF